MKMNLLLKMGMFQCHVSELRGVVVFSPTNPSIVHNESMGRVRSIYPIHEWLILMG